jgi:adenine deaminase
MCDQHFSLMNPYSINSYVESCDVLIFHHNFEPDQFKSTMSYLIKSVNVINESSQKIQDVLIKDQRIERIDSSISDAHATEISGEGKWLLPGGY